MHRPPLDVEIIVSETRLVEAIESAVKQTHVALDLESNGFYHYPERICLIQLATEHCIFLIDTLSINDVTPLCKLLADSKIGKIFHSGDYDVRSLDREWNAQIHNLFDTSIGSALVGSDKLGLAAVLGEHLGITINKNKKLQRSDWSIRPLTPEHVTYAANDVRHLADLKEVLDLKLTRLGRSAWVREECDRLTQVRFTPSDPERAFLSVKGCRSLDDRGVTVFRALYRYRDQEALRRNCPPFKVLNDKVLLELAANPNTMLSKITGIGRYARPPGSSGIRRAINEGLLSPLVDRYRLAPISRKRARIPYGTRSARKLSILKKWRMDQGKALNIDPGLVWPAISLERLSKNAGHYQKEFESQEVRRWQRDQFGESLIHVSESA